MYKASEICKKPLIGLYEAKLLGNIAGLWTDKRLKTIKFFEVKAAEENIFLLPVRHAFSISDAVTVKTEGYLVCPETLSNTNLAKCPLGGDIYALDGKFKGKLTDFEFEKDGKIISLFADYGKIAAEKVATAGDELLILKTEGMPAIRRARNMPKKVVNTQVSILGAEEEPSAVLFAQVKNIEVTPELVQAEPKNVSYGGRLDTAAEFEFLLGRQASKNIYSRAGKLLIGQGQIIDHEVLLLAERYFKLRELTVNS